MQKNLFTRREILRMGAFSSAAAYLSFNREAKGQVPVNGARNSRDVIRLWGNENPYGPSAKTRQAIVEAALDGSRYASSETTALEKMIAEREGVAPESVIIGTGSGEVLAMAGVAYGLERGEIIAADPTFGWLMTYAERIGAKVVRVPLDADHAHDLEEMNRRLSSNTKLVYVCNPNNPTSTAVAAAKLRDFVRATARKAPVLVDEAYLEYLDDFPAASMIDLVRQDENVIVLRTFSKIYGMAGARLGYGLAKPAIAAKIKSFRMTWLNPISLRAGLAALQDQGFVNESRQKNTATRRYLLSEMDKLKLAYAPNPQGNFIWLRLPAGNRDLPAKLAGSNIYIAGLNARPLDSDWTRVTVGTPAEMKSFAAAMQSIFKN